MRRFLVLSAALGAAACGRAAAVREPPAARAPGEREVDIARLEARREAATAALVTRTQAPDAALAVRALGRIGDPPAVARLIALVDGDGPLALDAAQALATAVLLGAEAAGAEQAVIGIWSRRRPPEQARLAAALGRLGSAAAVPVLTAALASEEPPELRVAAALALGVLGRRKVALDDSARAALVAAAAEAAPGLAHAVAYALAHEHLPEREAPAAASPGAAAKMSRGTGTPGQAGAGMSRGTGTPGQAGAGMSRGTGTPGQAGAGMSRRTGTPGAGQAGAHAPASPDAAGEALFRLAHAPDDETRAVALAGLARRKTAPEPTRALFLAALQDRDFRVQVAAVRGLLADADPGSAARLLAWVREALLPRADGPPAAEHAVFEALAGLVPLRDRVAGPWTAAAEALHAELEASLRGAPADARRGRAACLLAVLSARRETWRPPLSCAVAAAEFPPHERQVLEAGLLGDGLGGPLADRRARLTGLLGDADPRVRSAAAAAAAKSWARGEPFEAELVAALGDPSPAVAGPVADALAGRKNRAPPLGTPLVQALVRRTLREAGGDVELLTSLAAAVAASGAPEGEPACRAALGHDNPTARKAAGACLLALTGADPGPPAPARAPREPPAPPADPAGGPIAWRLTTERGDIEILLDPAVAPWHVGTLVALTRRGYYDGLTFHRVVPGFVVQGGDPEGTGWGGPGYTLPSEPSGGRFDRGAVGIADAGKDTGGSQFFIMHARAPHLEGRYTRVGEVVRGLDVALALQVGDRILRASVGPESSGHVPSGSSKVAPKGPSGQVEQDNPEVAIGIAACDAYLRLYRACEPRLQPAIMAGDLRSYRAESHWLAFTAAQGQSPELPQACEHMLRQLRGRCAAD